MAPLSNAVLKYALVKLAEFRFALVKSAEKKFAPIAVAVVSVAVISFAFARDAYDSVAPYRFAPESTVLKRFAPYRFASTRYAPDLSHPDQSTYGVGGARQFPVVTDCVLASAGSLTEISADTTTQATTSIETKKMRSARSVRVMTGTIEIV